MRSTLYSKPECLSNEQWLAYLEIRIKYGLIKIASLRQKCLSNGEHSDIIKVQNTNSDSFPNHEGVKGQLGGSKKRGVSGEITKFKRKGASMRATSDVEVRTDDLPATLKAGTMVTKIVDFAGGKKKNPVRVEPHLIRQYGGEVGSWTHTRGEAKVVDSNGKTRKAELHWFESKSVGQVGMKVKRYMEGDNEG